MERTSTAAQTVQIRMGEDLNISLPLWEAIGCAGSIKASCVASLDTPQPRHTPTQAENFHRSAYCHTNSRRAASPFCCKLPII